MIKMVSGYRHKEGRNVDAKRVQTRREGAKKAEAVPISPEQVRALKEQSDTPQGRRDALLMCLLLDHGLRCGEVAGLPVESINLSTGLFTFYRQKVDKVQTHQLTRDTLLSAMRYLEVAKPRGKLLMGSRKNGNLEGATRKSSTHLPAMIVINTAIVNRNTVMLFHASILALLVQRNQ